MGICVFDINFSNSFENKQKNEKSFKVMNECLFSSVLIHVWIFIFLILKSIYIG